MDKKYIIVLFKNKKKRKIIKGYNTEKRAKKFFNEKVKSNDIKFPMLYENAEKVEYEIGLLTNQSKIQKTLYTIDELGRNQIVNIEDPDFIFLDIKKYDLEEKIYDWQTEEKITYDYFYKKYLPSKELKSIFTVHNKIIIQINEDFNVFSLKNNFDSVRLLETLQEDFVNTGRMDGIFVRDTSTTQRKWIYNVLVENGFDKQRLYRRKTTFSKR
jgi:hypothetical protein